MDLPAIEELRALFRYEPETGALVRKERVGEKWWNTRFAGKAVTTTDTHGYIQVKLGKLNLRAHRIIWAMMTGCWPSADVDHINGVRNDNRWVNLREATRSQNNHNRHSVRLTAFPKGVTRHKASGRYRAFLNLGKKQISFGYFDTVAQAAAAYAERAPALLGQFYRGDQNV